VISISSKAIVVIKPTSTTPERIEELRPIKSRATLDSFKLLSRYVVTVIELNKPVLSRLLEIANPAKSPAEYVFVASVTLRVSDPSKTMLPLAKLLRLASITFAGTSSPPPPQKASPSQHENPGELNATGRVKSPPLTQGVRVLQGILSCCARHNDIEDKTKAHVMMP
jgi:hypothetical protein